MSHTSRQYASSEPEHRLCAVLTAELGFSPATLDPDDIERHSRSNAAPDSAPTIEWIGRKCASARLWGDRR